MGPSNHAIYFVHCSGVKFNEMVLKNIDEDSTERGAKAVPHNPMVGVSIP